MVFKFGRHCLIAEDQALIGLALEAYLEEVGFTVEGPFATNADALASLGQRAPELALVDVLLRDGPCLRLVRELRRRGIPFAFYSALKPDPVPPELESVPWLEKPVPREALIQVLQDLMSAQGKSGHLPVPSDV